MDTGIITILGCVFAALLILSEVIKKLIDHFIGKKEEKKETVIYPICEKNRDMLTNMSNKVDKLYEMHDRVDSDGTPLWYIPRSFSNTQKDIVKLQHDMIEKMAVITRLLDRIELRMSQKE